jgi:hypothetical protein
MHRLAEFGVSEFPLSLTAKSLPLGPDSFADLPLVGSRQFARSSVGAVNRA